jgi:hypothetical protein
MKSSLDMGRKRKLERRVFMKQRKDKKKSKEGKS